MNKLDISYLSTFSTPYKDRSWWLYKDYFIIRKRYEECRYDEELTVESIIYERYIQRCLRDGSWVKKAIIQKYYENLQ